MQLQNPLTQIFGVFVTVIDEQFFASANQLCRSVIDLLPVLEGLDVLLFTIPRAVYVAHPVGHCLVLCIDEIRHFSTFFDLKNNRGVKGEKYSLWMLDLEIRYGKCYSCMRL